MHRKLIYLLSVSILLIHPAIGAVDESEAELLERQHVLEVSVEHQPTDPHIRFYLADCYEHLGKFDEAAESYARCLQLNPSADLEKRARAALARVGSRVVPRQPQQMVDKRIESHGTNLTEKIRNDASRQIQQREAALNRSLADLDRKLKEDVDHVPRYLSLGYTGSVGNPNYSSEVSEIQRVARERRERLKNDFERSKADILAQAKRKIEDLRHTANHLHLQTKSTRGAVGLVRSGTNLHVRNYMNFPDASEADNYAAPIVPLRAAPAKGLAPSQLNSKKVPKSK